MKLIDLTGKKFTRLTVISRNINDKSGHPRWLCKCECGTEKVISGNKLRSGEVKSCGCLAEELVTKRNTSHGLFHTPEYTIWRSMKKRCRKNSRECDTRNYADRGIDVCDSWKNSFEQFFNDMGERPSDDYSIERIDNDKGYFPENCKWATRIEQQNNKRNTTFLTHDGVTLSASQWAKKIGVCTRTVINRVKQGWSVNKIIHHYSP